MRGKTSKATVLPGFWVVEHGGSMPEMGSSLWWSCLPKIYDGGPERNILLLNTSCSEITESVAGMK